MNLLHKIDLLLRHGEQAQARVAGRLAEQKQRQRALQETIDGLALQGDAIDRLLQSQKLVDCVVDRAALFALQQRQGVLRQQRHQLDFERDRVREQIAASELQQQQAQAEMQALARKQNKFQHWSDLQKRRRMLSRLQREDLETEERTVWKQ